MNGVIDICNRSIRIDLLYRSMAGFNMNLPTVDSKAKIPLLSMRVDKIGRKYIHDVIDV